jgi:AcrR family transcriptional regulator
MSKRKEHSYKELREIILDAAYELVYKEGIQAVSARNLAAKIGYSVGTLYNIFSNMDDILLYLNSRVLTIFITELKAKLSSSHSSVIDKLMMIARYYLEFSENYYNLWHLLFINKVTVNEELPKWYNKKIDTLYHLVSHHIKLLHRPGADIDSETCIYWASVHGLASLNCSGKLHYASSKSVDELTQVTVCRIFGLSS